MILIDAAVDSCERMHGVHRVFIFRLPYMPVLVKTSTPPRAAVEPCHCRNPLYSKDDAKCGVTYAAWTDSIPRSRRTCSGPRPYFNDALRLFQFHTKDEALTPDLARTGAPTNHDSINGTCFGIRRFALCLTQRTAREHSRARRASVIIFGSFS